VRGAIRNVALAALLVAFGPAQAQLFPDNEARKAILDLRAKVTEGEEQTRQRLAELIASNAQLTEQIQQMRRSMLEMNNQMEGLRGEVARLRGSDEQRTRDIGELQRQQRDLAQRAVAARAAEPRSVTIDGREFQTVPEESQQYEAALDLLRAGDFSGTATALTAFMARYPNSGYTDAARFWLGNALYGKRDYKEAIDVFRTFVVGAPQHPRAAEGLLAVANCQIEMKDTRGARTTLNELLRAYPESEAAVAGKERLAALR
jgi:tol-pal system protein YbgF